MAVIAQYDRHRAMSEQQPQTILSLLALLNNRLVINAFMAMGIAIFSTFLLVPNLAAWLQFNLAVPSEEMSFYYVVGGAASLIMLQFGGRLIDKLGALNVTLVLALFITLLLWDGFMHTPWLPSLAIFTLFMSFTAIRTIAAATVNTPVPQLWERAAFMSLQSVCQHVFSGLAAVVSSLILFEENGRLGNIAELAGLSLFLSVIQPLFLYCLVRQLGHSRTAMEEVAR